MKLKRMAFAILLTLFLTTNLVLSQDFVPHDYVTYVGYTGKELNLNWDEVAGADDYEGQLYSYEREAVTGGFITSNTNMVLSLQKSGHYVVMVRSRAKIDRSDIESKTLEELVEWVNTFKDENNFKNIDTTNKTKEELINDIMGQEFLYSVWATSTNPDHAMVDGESRAWWLYGHVAPPSVPIFNLSN